MNPVSLQLRGYILPSNCYHFMINYGWPELRRQVVDAEPV